MSKTIFELADEVRHLTAQIPRVAPISMSAIKHAPKGYPGVRRGRIVIKQPDERAKIISGMKRTLKELQASLASLKGKAAVIEKKIAAVHLLMGEIE